MTQYIYFVKCPSCEDESFDFFDEAKNFALGCLSDKPVITQVEVTRNDFGECTDSTDLGQVWSWEEIMSDLPNDTEFSKEDTFGDHAFNLDFEDADISGDSILDSVPDNFRRPVPADMSITDLVETLEENEEMVECKECFNLVAKENCTKSDKGYICKECAGITLEEASLSDIAAAYNKETDLELNTADLNDTIASATVDAEKTLDGFDSKADFNKHYNLIRRRRPQLFETHQEDSAAFDNEDTVTCTWCEEPFDKSECRYEVDMGWLCSRCQQAIMSRGESLTFRENTYWDFLNEEDDSDVNSQNTRKDMCPECGEKAFNRKTEICENCGFETKSISD